MKTTLLVAALLLICTSCGGDKSPPKSEVFDTTIELDFDFHNDLSGWKAGFAEYMADYEELYGLYAGFEQLPPPLNEDFGLSVIGNNHSDDLFMYVKKEFTGLKPNTRYALEFQITFATDSPRGCIGIGGAPGVGSPGTELEFAL